MSSAQWFEKKCSLKESYSGKGGSNHDFDPKTFPTTLGNCQNLRGSYFWLKIKYWMRWDLYTSGSHSLASNGNENVQILFSLTGARLAHAGVWREVGRDYRRISSTAFTWLPGDLQGSLECLHQFLPWLWNVYSHVWPTTDPASWGTITFRVIWTTKKLATWSKILVLLWQPLKQKWLGRTDAQSECHPPTTDQFSMWDHPSVAPVTLIFYIIIKKLACRILKQNA